MGALRTDEGLQQTRPALVINSREREERQFCICTEPDRPFDTEMIRPDPDRFGQYHQYQTEDRSTLWLPRRAHLRCDVTRLRPRSAEKMMVQKLNKRTFLVKKIIIPE